MIYTLSAKKIELYINTKKKTAAQIKSETGCDVLINAGLYDMKTFKPVLYLKKDGEYLSRVWNSTTPYGFGWNKSDTTLKLDTNHAKYDNFISCTEICRDGKKVKMDYDSRGGIRGRSAVGVTKDGQVSIICTADGTSGAMTPEKLQTYAISNGWSDGIMLDSGGSCQCITPSGKISSSRIVHNYICIWESDSVKTYSKSKQGTVKLSKNFSVREFAVAGNDTVQVNTRLVDVLQDIRDHFGKPVNITRQAYHGASGANVYIKDISPIEIARYAESLKPGEIGVEKTSVYIYVCDQQKYWDNTSGTKKVVDTFEANISQVVKDRFGFDDSTMKYLEGYKYADALLKKLATAK